MCDLACLLGHNYFYVTKLVGQGFSTMDLVVRFVKWSWGCNRFGRIWGGVDSIHVLRLPRFVWRSTVTDAVFAGCQNRFNCLLKFLKDN
jgi:hypothetical protein